MYAASSDSSQNGAAVPTFGTFEPPIASELARYFDEVCHHDSVGSSAKLRNATETLVRRLKADGLPP